MRLGEADKLMTFFTRSHGKVGAVAKSALKAGSRFGGRLELFAYNAILLAKGKNLDLVSKLETTGFAKTNKVLRRPCISQK